MADELGYSRGQVSLYLNDKGAPPRRPILRIWALRCGVPFQWLAFGKVDTSPDDPSEQVIRSSTCMPSIGNVIPLKAA